MSTSASGLTGRVAIITGGASGLGLCTARQFHAAGYSVVVADTREEAARAAVEGIDPVGERTLAVRADVTVAQSVDDMVSATIERFGCLDVLVNNAGYAQPSPTHTLSDELWLRMLDVHLNGTFRCSRAAYGALSRSQAPAIVNVSSIAAAVGMPMRASYSAAKAGIEGFTRSIAVEWAPAGIRVNAVAPGYILTPLMAELVEAGTNSVEEMSARVPMGRMGAPAEIAAVTEFLASEAALYVTGQVILVDGARTIDGRFSFGDAVAPSTS